jgi:hypothetical protein
MNLCVTCQNITPHALGADRSPEEGDGQTKMGYQHLVNYEDLAVSGQSCPLCALLYSTIKPKLGRGLKAHRKPHSIILMSGTATGSSNLPSGVASMTALVTNSDLRGIYNVWASPGMFEILINNSKIIDEGGND